MFASSRQLPRCFHQISRVVANNQTTKVYSGTSQRCISLLSGEAVDGRNPSSGESARSCSLQGYLHQTRGFFTSKTLCEIRVVKTPQFAESITEGDVKWDKGVGDVIAMDDIVGEIETDKTSIPIHAPVGGVIEELMVPDGESVVPGQDLFKINTDGAGAAPAAPAVEATSAPTPAAPTPAAPAPASTPSGVGPVPTTPPPVPPIPTAPMSSIPTSQVKVTPVVEVTGTSPERSRTEERVKMNRMRQRVAQRLKDAQNTCAMLTTFNEIDMSSLMELRTRYKETFLKKHGLKLGFMSTFLKASATSLESMPAVNAVIDDMEIVYRNYVDISVAVATPKGLVVPVLRNVEHMNFYQIEAGLSEMGEKARSGRLAIEDMDGGTFTVSNGGVFGSLMGTPIINPPQSAILGMHGIFDRPVAINGKVEIRPMMYVALTYDHRLIDGREATIFLKKIKTFVEDPRVLLLDL